MNSSDVRTWSDRHTWPQEFNATAKQDKLLASLQDTTQDALYPFLLMAHVHTTSTTPCLHCLRSYQQATHG